MEIKKITKTIEEVVGYVAFDGKEFKVKEECEKYEGTAHAVIKREFIEKCVRYEVEEAVASDCGNGYYCAGCGEDYYDAVVHIHNEDELRIAQMFQEIVRPTVKRRFTTEDIGKDLIVVIGERDYKTKQFNYDNCYIYGTIDEMVEEFRKSIGILFVESNKTPRE